MSARLDTRPPRGDPAAVGRCSCSTTSLPSPGGVIVVLRIAGEVDLSSRQLVETSIRALLDHRPLHLVIDLSGLVFCDVRGVVLLVEAGAIAAARGVGYSISAPTRQAERVWALLGPDSELPVRYPTVSAGVLAIMAGQLQQLTTGAG